MTDTDRAGRWARDASCTDHQSNIHFIQFPPNVVLSLCIFYSGPVRGQARCELDLVFPIRVLVPVQWWREGRPKTQNQIKIISNFNHEMKRIMMISRLITKNHIKSGSCLKSLFERPPLPHGRRCININN